MISFFLLIHLLLPLAFTCDIFRLPKFFILFASLFCVAFLSARSNGGYDYLNYKYSFEYQNLSVLDGLYGLVSEIFFGLNNGFFLLTLFINCLIWLTIFISFINVSKNRWFNTQYCLFFIYSEFLFFSMNQTKQALAAAFVIYILTKNNSSFIEKGVTWFFAIASHFSSIAWLFLSIFSSVIKSRKLQTLLLIGSMLVVLNIELHDYISPLFSYIPHYGNIYAPYISDKFQMPLTGLFYLPGFLLTLYIMYSSNFSNPEKNISFFSEFLLILFIQFEYLERFCFTLIYIKHLLFFGRFFLITNLIQFIAKIFVFSLLIFICWFQVLAEQGKHGVFFSTW